MKKGYWFAHAYSTTNLFMAKSSNTYLAIYKDFWKAIWDHNLLSRLAVWSWQAAQDKLPTNTELHKRNLCPMAKDTRLMLGSKINDIIHEITPFNLWFSLQKQKGKNALWAELTIC